MIEHYYIQLADYQGSSFRRFTGKEKDSESGYYYFGARYFMPTLSIWNSVDPMADKYPSLSPYSYCAWNPMKLVDPNGDTVVLVGSENNKKEALRQMQSRTKNLHFDLAENGSITYSGSATNEEELYMTEILNSTNIRVELNAIDNNYYNGIPLEEGGGFCGNRLNVDGTSVTAFQVVNVCMALKNDEDCKNTGNFIWHEVSEAYEGGIISLQKRTSAPAATTVNDKTIYKAAHYNAGRFFPGTISEYEVKIPRPFQGVIGRKSQIRYKYTR